MKKTILYAIVVIVILVIAVIGFAYFSPVGKMICGPCGCRGDECGGCTPLTCANLGRNCGSWPDGCGGTLNCGTCSSGQTCSNGNCIVQTSTCDSTCKAQGFSSGTCKAGNCQSGEISVGQDGCSSGLCCCVVSPKCSSVGGACLNNANCPASNSVHCSSNPFECSGSTPCCCVPSTCGGSGQPCCSGSTCNAGLTCTSGICTTPSFDFSLSANPTSGTALQGRYTTLASSITTTLVSGITQNVQLSVSGCPTSISCFIYPTHGNPAFASTLWVNVTSSTPLGTYAITVNGVSGGVTRSTAYTAIVT